MAAFPGSMKIRVHGACWIFLAMLLTAVPLPWIGGAMLAAGVHELFHWAVLRACRVPIRELLIAPGGARLETGAMTRGEAVFCALAGPAGSLLLFGIARWLPRTAICGMMQGVFNLLPIYPLDGGRVLRALVADLPGKWPQTTERLVTLLSAGVLAWFLRKMWMEPWLLLGFALFGVRLFYIRGKSPCKSPLF